MLLSSPLNVALSSEHNHMTNFYSLVVCETVAIFTELRADSEWDRYDKQKKKRCISRERTDRLVGFSWADGTALSKWNDGIVTVCHILTDDLVTQHCPSVAHADAARLWLPYSTVCILLAILDAAA